MSFTMNIKEEICTLDFPLLENIAELSGFIRSSWKKDINRIELFTENAKVSKRLSLLIKNVYGIESIIERRKLANFRNKKIYVVIIDNKVIDILKDLSLIDDNNLFIDSPKEYITGSLEEEKAYIRGSFLSKGSITDPKSSYHLEMLYDNKYEAVFIQRLLNNFELNSKIIIRDTKYMVYIKEAEKISDFLKILGVTKEFLYYEDVRVEKEEKNITNRLNNCEQANMDKIIMTATRIINEIDTIDEKLGLDMLDEKIKETAIYRKKYPEVSLDELSKIITIETGKKVTKSGLNHRFRKIKQIYESLNK